MSTTATYTVTGMTCSHCVNAVTEEVTGIPGVTDVQVDLGSGALTITSAAPVERSAVLAAVDEAGYALADPS
ncbi:heavy-metal-associated domain-containing protein [Microlunatus lacustris]